MGLRQLFLISFLIFIGIAQIFAQPYLAIDSNKRHRFAQTTIGLTFEVTNSGSTAWINKEGHREDVAFEPQLFSRFHIGGTHFWGHAEFYFSAQIVKLFQSTHEGLNYKLQQGDVFGIKYYPWRIEHGKLRPFIGISLTHTDYHQEDKIKDLSYGNTSQLSLPLHAGLTFNYKQSLFELSMRYNYHSQIPYYISKTERADVNIPKFTISLGYRWMPDVTLPGERRYEDGTVDAKIRSLQAKKKMNSFYLAVGPSSAFFINVSKYNESRPWLGKNVVSPGFLEFGGGYFNYKLQSHAYLFYRKYHTKLDAFGTTQKLSREALTLEAHHYLFDYHGFDPYIGAGISYEHLFFHEHTNGDEDKNYKNEMFAPSIVFGWDILPDKLLFLTVRTNVRYFPTLHIDTPEGRLDMQQIEFNFIQLVLYPDRMFWIRNEDKLYELKKNFNEQ